MNDQLAPNTSQTGVRPLEGKTALVTGGSRGIGTAIVHRLTTDGAQVAFTYASAKRQADAVAEATGALPVLADSSDPEAVRAAVRRTVEHFGTLDILVNNAGVSHTGPIENFPLEDFDRMVSINVRGVFTAVQAATPHLGHGGRIITIGSVNADRIPAPGASVYALTKAAVAGFTRGLVPELSPRGITVNNVQVGPTNTDMNPADGPFAETIKQFIPVGHYGEPADIASAVAYLASPEARFITGTSWNVDGGAAL